MDKLLISIQQPARTNSTAHRVRQAKYGWSNMLCKQICTANWRVWRSNMTLNTECNNAFKCHPLFGLIVNDSVILMMDKIHFAIDRGG